MEKLDLIIEFPFEWMRKLTIPPCEEEEYDNRLVIIWPLLGIPINLWLIYGNFAFMKNRQF